MDAISPNPALIRKPALLLALILGACSPSAAPIPPIVAAQLPPAELAPTASTSSGHVESADPTLQADSTNVPASPVPNNQADSLRFERWVNLDVGWAWDRDDWRILRSADGGSTWTDVTPEGAQVGYVAALDSEKAWTSATTSNPSDDSSTVFRTTDAGQSWESYLVPHKLALVEFVDTDHGWGVASPQGCGAGSCWIKLYQTSDSGKTWSALSPTSPYGSGRIDDVLGPGTLALLSDHALSFSDTSTAWLYGGYAMNKEHGLNAVLMVSRDSGSSWSELRVPIPPAAPGDGIPQEVGEPFFFTPQVGYFAAWYALHDGSDEPRSALVVFATEDGGYTWRARPKALSVFPSREPVKFASPVEFFAYCGDALCISRNAGFTWEAVESNLQFSTSAHGILVDFEFVDGQHGWALVAGPGGVTSLFRTIDGGHYWEKLEPAVLTSP